MHLRTEINFNNTKLSSFKNEEENSVESYSNIEIISGMIILTALGGVIGYSLGSIYKQYINQGYTEID